MKFITPSLGAVVIEPAICYVWDRLYLPLPRTITFDALLDYLPREEVFYSFTIFVSATGAEPRGMFLLLKASFL